MQKMSFFIFGVPTSGERGGVNPVGTKSQVSSKKLKAPGEISSDLYRASRCDIKKLDFTPCQLERNL